MHTRQTSCLGLKLPLALGFAASMAACSMQLPQQPTPQATPKPSSSSLPQERPTATLLGSLGQATVDISGDTNVNESTDAILTSVNLASLADGVGPGLHATFVQSDDKLLGSGPSFRSSVQTLTVFPHFSFPASTSPLQTALRIGPEFRQHTLDLGTTPNQHYRSYGLAAEVAPLWTFAQWNFAQDDLLATSIYTRLHGGVGIATIDAPDCDCDAFSSVMEGEAGLQLRSKNLLLRAGYMAQQTRYERRESRYSTRINHASFGYHGLFLSFGVTW